MITTRSSNEYEDHSKRHSHSNIASKSETLTSNSPFQIAEWPSSNDLPNYEKSANRSNKPPICSCYPLKKGSYMAGKHKTNRPKVSLVEFFVEELENPKGKIQASNKAIITKDVTYLYQDIHDLSTNIAIVLKSKVEGIVSKNPDDDLVIALCVPHPRQKTIVCKLATLKLGCCYLPVDITILPQKRIQEIFTTFQPLIIIGTEHTPEYEEKLLPLKSLGFNVVALEDLWKEAAGLQQTQLDLKTLIIKKDYRSRPCALFYTHGGDGPEAVRIGNDALWNRIMWEWETFPYKSNELLVHQSSPYEVQSIIELFVPLLAGKPILVMDPLHLDSFLSAVRSCEVTRIYTYPVLLRAMLITESMYQENHKDTQQGPVFKSLLEKIKTWFCSRGTLRAEICQKFFSLVPRGTKLVQTFGVLEALQTTTYKTYTSGSSVKDLEFYEVIPTELLLDNMRIYLTDKDMNIVEPGEIGEVCVSGVQLAISYSGGSNVLNGTGLEFMPNPFYSPTEDPIYSRIFKTGNFARMFFGKGICSRPTIVFNGRSEYHLVMNNLRATCEDIFRQLREIKDIVSCHVMVYRPCTSDQMVLAFVVVNRRNPVTTDYLIEKLRENLPEYLVPLIILVDGFPVKDFKIDHQALMQLYFDDRQAKLQFDYNELQLKTPEELRAAKVFCRIMFNVTGTKVSAIAEHMDWPISKLRVRFSNTPLIILMLMECGYYIGFDEFLETKSVRELIEKLARRREIVAETGTRRWAGAFKAEPATIGMRRDIQKLTVGSLASYLGFQSASFYAGVKEKDIKQVFPGFWESIMSNPLSVAIRHVETKEIVGAIFNMDYIEKTKSKHWAETPVPIKYRLETIDQFDKEVEMRVDFKNNESCLSTTFIVVNYDYYDKFDACLQMIELLFEATFEIARKHNYTHICSVSFDYTITSFLVERLGYEVIGRVQLNTLIAADGKRPFKLAPDYLDETFLMKSLKDDNARAQGDSGVIKCVSGSVSSIPRIASREAQALTASASSMTDTSRSQH